MSDRGMTLVEVLIGTFVVVMACVTAASIYVVTAQKMQKSMAEAEAATLAEAVRAYAAGNFHQGQTYYSHEVTLPAQYAPTIKAGLVWKLVVDGALVAGTSDLYKATLSMARDDDGDGEYEQSDMDNTGVTTFVFYIED